MLDPFFLNDIPFVHRCFRKQNAVIAVQRLKLPFTLAQGQMNAVGEGLRIVIVRLTRIYEDCILLIGIFHE
ncbi:hypothetical protein D3C71_2053430 [compost metagenome]